MMGYFSNGTEGEMYESAYCDRCVHQGPEDGPGCAVWFAHLIHNYDECNNKDSILHMLIPLETMEFDDGIKQQVNGECLMFIEQKENNNAA